jgi:hypothetical protein
LSCRRDRVLNTLPAGGIFASSLADVARQCAPILIAVFNTEQVELAAVCQCSGNRRGLSNPHAQGVQWGYGAMGNARWKGVRLRDVPVILDDLARNYAPQ